MKNKIDSSIHWQQVFMFSSEFGRRESLVWRKYAPSIAEVHAIGCQKQTANRRERPQVTYFGAIDAQVGKIRAIKSRNGIQLEVEHDPSDGQGQHHAEVRMVPRHQKPSPNDKSEIKAKLQALFGSLQPHRCPE